MATISYEVCDRCKKEISTHSLKRSTIPAYRKRKILWITAGYIYEDTKELCEDCTVKLDDFLNNKN